MQKRLIAVALALLLGATTQARASTPAEKGRRLYDEGRFDAAVESLHAAVAQTKAEKDAVVRRRDLAEAYLYLALSHAALGERGAAKEAFKSLLRTDLERRLDANLYAPRIVELFEEARADVLTPGWTPPPDAANRSPNPPRFATSFGELPRLLEPGAGIQVVDKNGRTTKGTFSQTSGGALSLWLPGGDPESFREAEVALIEKRGDSLSNGAGIGLAIGVVFGLLNYGLQGEIAHLVVPPLFYGAVGALIDWRRVGTTVVYRSSGAESSQVSLSLRPLPRGAAIEVGFRLRKRR